MPSPSSTGQSSIIAHLNQYIRDIYANISERFQYHEPIQMTYVCHEYVISIPSIKIRWWFKKAVVIRRRHRDSFLDYSLLEQHSFHIPPHIFFAPAYAFSLYSFIQNKGDRKSQHLDLVLLAQLWVLSQHYRNGLMGIINRISPSLYCSLYKTLY